MTSQTKPVRIFLLGFSQAQNPASTYRLMDLLESAGLEVNASAWIEQGIAANPLSFVQRAEEFSRALTEGADWILDVTGGDGANGVLDHLDYEGYKNSSAILAGYSDVSCVLNALAMKTDRPALLFQASGNENEKDLLQLLKKESDVLASPVDENGQSVYGKDPILFGGNVRSFLKLAGTEYLPPVQGKSLFLEACSTSWILFVSYLVQLEQMGVLAACSRLIIGQLTAIDSLPAAAFGKENLSLVDRLRKEGIALPEQTVRTLEVGHSRSARALWIGKRPACFGQAGSEERN